MLSAIVDNSTLTAVQRLIGDVPVARSFAIEGDVAAYDQYLQSLLLYDEVAAVDDYKEEYKIERKNSFKEIIFLNPKDIEYNKISDLSISKVEDIFYKIVRGKIASGPISDFLNALDLHVAPAWYMQSSDWFLRLRILADESDIHAPKYGALMNSIQAQVSQRNRSESALKHGLSIETRQGDLLDLRAKGDGSVDDDVKEFSAGLNWIAQRTAFYVYLSAQLSSAFVIHPIRHAFAGQYILNQLTRGISEDVRRGALSFFADEAGEIRSRSDELIFSSGMKLKLPFFAAWAVGYSGNPRNGYDHVLQIRSSSEALTLRAHFREIEELSYGSDQSLLRQAAAKLRSAIAQDLDQLRKRFVGRNGTPSTGASVNLLSLSPSISISNLIPDARNILRGKAKRSATLLRNIGDDFLRIPSLGAVSDQFSYSRKIRKGTDFVPDRTRVEEEKWRNASSHWKKPL